ncbi:MAG: hypothetical protein WCF17_18185, partial [Terracidiphilus sp.]
MALIYPPNQTFYTVGATGNSTPPALSGTAVNLNPATAEHNAYNMNYGTATTGLVNDEAFQANYTFVPNGSNLSFVLQNNTSPQGSPPYGTGVSFSSGAGCEGSIFQAFPNGGGWDPPNNIFAIWLTSSNPLTDANGSGKGGGSAGFTYSGTQLYQTGQDPCNPRDGTEPYFYYTKQISTSPVNLTLGTGYGPQCEGASNVNGCATSTGDTYSVTITYTGSNVTEQLYDVTASGSCPGASCFTYTWSNISIPSMVDGTTARPGLAGSTNTPTGYNLLIETFAYTVLSAADTPTFSPAAGTYGSTQTVTISDGSSNSIICYNTTGNPSTNGIGGCENGTLYSGAVSVSKGQTLYA